MKKLSLLLSMCVGGCLTMAAGCKTKTLGMSEWSVSWGTTVTVKSESSKTADEASTMELDFQPLVNYVVELKGDEKVEGPPEPMPDEPSAPPKVEP